MIITTTIRKASLRQVLTIGMLVMAIAMSGCKLPLDYFADQMIYPERQELPKTPAQYDLKFEDVEFESVDGIRLQAWLIPAESEKLILITHPMGFTRYGYTLKMKPRVRTKVEVEFLKTVQQLNHAGYAVLMFDFRNHGQSGRSHDGITGAGLNEYQDVVAAVRYIKSNPALQNKKIGILGHCMGANSVIIAFSKAPLVMKDVTCFIAEQPVNMVLFYRYYTTDIYGGLFAKSLPLVEKRCIQKGGYPWKEMSSLPYAKDITAPTLFVQAKSDPWIDTQFVMDVYTATPAPKEILWLEGNMTRFDTYNYFGQHPEKMLEFFKKHM